VLFPEHGDLTSAVCASIFGDGAAACVVAGAEHEGFGLRLGEGSSYTVPNSEHYIHYEITDGGYHLTLDRAVMHAVPKLAPIIADFVRAQHADGLEFVIAHTGGRRILDGLARSLNIDARLLETSRASLREVGNTASVSVFDVLRRAYACEHRELRRAGAHGIAIAFGPGFTMELLAVSWA
jgi:type III polyketide synthase